MPIIYREEILKLFQLGTWICSNRGLLIEPYMQEKHGWSKDQYDEYSKVYIDSFL